MLGGGVAYNISQYAAFYCNDIFPHGQYGVQQLFQYSGSIARLVRGAYICGKHRRKKGLAEGIVCGFIIYTVLSLLGVFFGVGIQSADSLIRLIASGAVGGVSGVNSKRPKRLTE